MLHGHVVALLNHGVSTAILLVGARPDRVLCAPDLVQTVDALHLESLVLRVEYCGSLATAKCACRLGSDLHLVLARTRDVWLEAVSCESLIEIEPGLSSIETDRVFVLWG